MIVPVHQNGKFGARQWAHLSTLQDPVCGGPGIGHPKIFNNKNDHSYVCNLLILGYGSQTSCDGTPDSLMVWYAPRECPYDKPLLLKKKKWIYF